METVRVAVYGASGYSGAELLRRLERHPGVEVVCLTSRQHAGRTAREVFSWLDGRTKLGQQIFAEPNSVEPTAGQFSTAFLALPHGAAAEFAVPLLRAGVRVLDLSADFRVRDPAVYQTFYHADHPAPELLSKAVYGLTEIYRDRLPAANLVACPGCYPTSVLLPVIPLIRARRLRPETMVVNSLSAVSGAGRKPELSLLFVECNESMRPYGLPAHRHLSEIEQEISIAADRPVMVQFAPHLIPVNRGIITTIHVDAETALTESEIGEVFAGAYGNDRFVRLLGSERYPDSKDVATTNVVDLAWRVDPRTGKVILMSALDNLVKGAAGQAIQCFNVMHGWDEAVGLG